MSLLKTFLSGVRVLDLSRHLPGPLCTLYLADMGAEVIKIEPPQGDEIRVLGPRDTDGRPVFFETINAGKSTRRMDLKDAEARQAFFELIRTADVLVESFRPGVLDRLGIGYDTLKKLNPGLILCSLNGFGTGNANEKRAGHDNTFLALAGVLDRNAGTDGRPLFFEPPVADCAASLTSAISILGALRMRDRSGEGCQLEVALADSVMPLQMLQVAEMEATGVTPSADNGLFSGGTAYYQSYATSDGRHVALGAVESKFWVAFCNAAHRPDWIDRQHEPRPQKHLIAELRDFFASLSFDEAKLRFESIDCCFAPILDLREALESEHIESRELIQRGTDGRRQVLFPVKVNGKPPSLRMPVRDADETQDDTSTDSRTTRASGH
jgi:crotonobetainyl-CoA:carnitine CoA-transferase CaiB-like acyl-CoA transferase